MSMRSSKAFRQQASSRQPEGPRRRLHSAAAVLLLGLYAAAVWHGAGDHHHAHPVDAHAGCGTHACAPAPAASHEHGAEHDPDHSDSHACALCTLLHAPATPGILLAAPPVLPEVLAADHTPAAIIRVAVAGNPPSRAPPFLSA